MTMTTKTIESQFTNFAKSKASREARVTPSAPPISVRGGVAGVGNEPVARRKGKEPMGVDARAQRLQDQKPNDDVKGGQSSLGAPLSQKTVNSTTTATNKKTKRPLVQTFAQAEREAQLEREKLEKAKLLTKTKLREVFGSSFAVLQGSLLSVVDAVDRYVASAAANGDANAAAVLATAAAENTSILSDKMRAAAIRDALPLVRKMGHAAMRCVSACSLSAAASRAVVGALKSEMISTVTGHHKRDEFFVEKLVKPAVYGDLGEIGQAILEASTLSLEELKGGVVSRTGELAIDRSPSSLSFVPAALLHRFESLDDKLRAELAVLPALACEFDSAFDALGKAAKSLVDAVGAVADRTKAKDENIYELFGEVDFMLIKDLVDTAGVAAAVAFKRTDAVFSALTTSVELHRVKDERDRALLKSLGEVALPLPLSSSPSSSGDAALVAALLAKFGADVKEKLDAADDAAATVDAAFAAADADSSLSSDKRSRAMDKNDDNKVPPSLLSSPAAVAAAAAAVAVADADKTIAAAMAKGGLRHELAMLMERDDPERLVAGRESAAKVAEEGKGGSGCGGGADAASEERLHVTGKTAAVANAAAADCGGGAVASASAAVAAAAEERRRVTGEAPLVANAARTAIDAAAAEERRRVAGKAPAVVNAARTAFAAAVAEERRRVAGKASVIAVAGDAAAPASSAAAVDEERRHQTNMAPVVVVANDASPPASAAGAKAKQRRQTNKARAAPVDENFIASLVATVAVAVANSAVASAAEAYQRVTGRIPALSDGGTVFVASVSSAAATAAADAAEELYRRQASEGPTGKVAPAGEEDVAFAAGAAAAAAVSDKGNTIKVHASVPAVGKPDVAAAAGAAGAAGADPASASAAAADPASASAAAADPASASAAAADPASASAAAADPASASAAAADPGSASAAAAPATKENPAAAARADASNSDNDHDDDNNSPDSKPTASDPKTTEKLFFAHWPPPSRVRPPREQIIENLGKVAPPTRVATDDVEDQDLADDKWRGGEAASDQEALVCGTSSPGERVPINQVTTRRPGARSSAADLQELRRSGGG